MVMATVFAYWEISSARLNDVVPMIIWNTFVHDFSAELGEKLVENLELSEADGVARCEAFAKEDSTVQAQRQALLNRKERLVRATDVLNRLL
jgi:Dynamin GTPase effector domain